MLTNWRRNHAPDAGQADLRRSHFRDLEYFADHAASPARPSGNKTLAYHAHEFRKQLAAGVPIAMGSDVGPFPHGTQAREFELMVKYGMTPLASMQAGTLNGAKLLGWQGQIGALKPGYLADIIAVPGNPLRTSRLEESFVCHEGRRSLPQIASSGAHR